jgi:guanosine-3',5'-bis(diphosphate) 3'-pyrophosphohydrolase
VFSVRQLLSDTPGVDDALELIEDAYQTRLRRSGRTAQHPISVGLLLAADEQPPSVVVTGLLHDVLEDTDVTVDELRDRFEPQITRSVEALTQDPSIAKHRLRKAALRRQILAAGSEVAAVSLADKLAKLRGRAERPPDRKLAHYRATLEDIEGRYGRTRLSELLREQLARWPDT